MSFTDAIDQVGRTADGEQLDAASAADQERESAVAFFAIMETVTDEEVARSSGAAMDDGALFEACKRAGVPGLIVGDERMSTEDMRRALVAAVKREVMSEAAPVAMAQPDPQPPTQPISAPAPAPAPVYPGLEVLEPSRNGKYTIRLPGGAQRKYVSLGGHLQPVFNGGEVDVGSFSQRDIDAILRAGVELVPCEPVFRKVTVKLDVPVDVDPAPAEELLQMIAADISRMLVDDPERVASEARDMRERRAEATVAAAQDDELVDEDPDDDTGGEFPDNLPVDETPSGERAPTSNERPAKGKRRRNRGARS